MAQSSLPNQLTCGHGEASHSIPCSLWTIDTLERQIWKDRLSAKELVTSLVVLVDFSAKPKSPNLETIRPLWRMDMISCVVMWVHMFIYKQLWYQKERMNSHNENWQWNSYNHQIKSYVFEIESLLKLLILQPSSKLPAAAEKGQGRHNSTKARPSLWRKIFSGLPGELRFEIYQSLGVIIWPTLT